MNPQDRRQNDNEASEVGEAFSLSPRERAGVGNSSPLKINPALASLALPRASAIDRLCARCDSQL
jgi:hypothetical protein